MFTGSLHPRPQALKRYRVRAWGLGELPGELDG